jgi:mono/diheme cytochrome c family protein
MYFAFKNVQAKAFRFAKVLVPVLLFFLAMLGVSSPVFAIDSVLEVFDGIQSHHFKRSELLGNAATREISLVRDAAYNKPMKVQAIPVAALMPQVAQIASLQVVALDGFVANISGSVLAGSGQAYIAIEPADMPWPALKPGSAASAGPFYLVWLTPEKAEISNEQWPYQIAKIAAVAPLQQRFPQLLPKASNKLKFSSELRGLQVYISNCSVCHQLNGAGDASIGPDLNRPYSPTEYFQEVYLRKLIRNPASVRSWKQSAMPGFNQQSISDAQLDALIAYFKLMAKQRRD